MSIFPSPRCFRMQGVTASCAFLQVRLNHSFQRTEKKGLLTLTLSCSISASLSVPSAFTSFVSETFPAALTLLRKLHSLVSDNFGAAHSVLIAVLTFQLTSGSPLSADKPVQMLCSRASEQIWKVGWTAAEIRDIFPFCQWNQRQRALTQEGNFPTDHK